MAKTATATGGQRGILGLIERAGNKLPDPVFIFFYLIAALMLVSIVASFFGLSAKLNDDVLAGMGQSSLDRFGIKEDGIIYAISLLSAENIQRLWVEMPKTFTHFHPLGYVLVVMLGAGVAERSGLFATAMRAAVSGAPKFLLTPVVALVAMIGNHAADAAYVVLIPLAGVLFASAGRHPLAGIAAAFAGVSGGFSANIAPGQLDALLFGITQQAGEVLVPSYVANIAGNWYFIAAMTVVFTPIIWFVTDMIIEPRFGKYVPEGHAANSVSDNNEPITPEQRKGLRNAGFACLIVVFAWALMTLWPWGTPLIDDEGANANAELVLQLRPLFQSLVAAFFILFLAAGWAYGSAAGTIKDKQDVVDMMSEAMKDLGYYLVLAFAAAHFVEMFIWSNLGLISAVHGADAIENSGLPLWALLGVIVVFSGMINLFVGSASAKWALLAPVLVPMLMLLGVSPEGATAAYRVGDSATNIITPLMVYFPLILIFCQRWVKEFGIGSLTAMMIPYSIWIMITGVVLMMAWVYLGWPLGPGASISYTLPGAGG
ncbi:AbgT family transporter [Parvularcula sp. IMCC14364]|uniref:AbgT family transporter n=1 Tax=Parvularcula sp. IMCC14364 TaxID=3067902 RepID=UPI0027429333|nr:AbgT family transporter [Parvularcula sp. IMCC14364]